MKTLIQKHSEEVQIGDGFRYDLLHELGHLICGFSCCREHAEFEAHGAAKALAILLNVDVSSGERNMDTYAGRSSHKACGRIVKRNKKREVKSEEDTGN